MGGKAKTSEDKKNALTKHMAMIVLMMTS